MERNPEAFLFWIKASLNPEGFPQKRIIFHPTYQVFGNFSASYLQIQNLNWRIHHLPKKLNTLDERDN
ncbi:hypothetical protein B0E43_08520 [Algoriphagus sp. A40]|nr:hypothetical protein B0E43_08520 [Algoriphagus sp. A40]